VIPGKKGKKKGDKASSNCCGSWSSVLLGFIYLSIYLFVLYYFLEAVGFELRAPHLVGRYSNA
jgi:hypothetical protein